MRKAGMQRRLSISERDCDMPQCMIVSPLASVLAGSADWHGHSHDGPHPFGCSRF